MKLLLILMTLASVAMANDAKMKALIVGTWSRGDKEDYNFRFTTYEADGTMLVGVQNLRMKWDIKDGVLDKIDTPEIEGVPRDQWQGKTGGYSYRYTILLLTKHELLLQDTKDKSIYEFMSR